MQTVAETPTFSRQADKLFNEDERRELIDFLARNPLAGDEIPGTGSVRKLRFAAFREGPARRCAGDLLLSGRNNASLCAARLCEIRETQPDTR